MKKLIYLPIIITVLLAQSCSTAKIAKETAYAGVYKERPLSIAVMPPINNTNNVEAKEFFYLTVPQVICERGYYVLSPFLCMELFKSESAYDAEMFINTPLEKFREILGADVVLFTTISKWEKSTIGSTVTVTVEYDLRSTKSNEVLFQRKGTITYDTSIMTSGGGLLGVVVSMAASAMNTAATDYTEVAYSCNQAAMSDLPAGKYSPLYDTDQQTMAGAKEFKATIKK